MKRNKLDQLFSRYIRERDRWTCRVCGKQYPKGSQGLHCSHIFSRRHSAIRYDERNAVAKCFSCHQWYGGNPVEGGEWARRELGDDVIDELMRLKQKPFKRSKQWEAEIEAELRRKLECLT